MGTPIKEGKTIIAVHQKLDKHDPTTKRPKQQPTANRKTFD